MTASEIWWAVAAALSILGALAILLSPLPPVVDRLLRTAGALAVGAVAVGLWALP